MVGDRNNRPKHPNSPERSEGAEGLMGAGFAVVRRGYDPDGVEAYLRHLDVQMQILAADRDAAVEQSRQMGVELEACRSRVERLRGQVSAFVRARADRRHRERSGPVDAAPGRGRHP